MKLKRVVEVINARCDAKFENRELLSSLFSNEGAGGLGLISFACFKVQSLALSSFLLAEIAIIDFFLFSFFTSYLLLVSGKLK